LGNLGLLYSDVDCVGDVILAFVSTGIFRF
jgi:hypothetical protein